VQVRENLVHTLLDGFEIGAALEIRRERRFVRVVDAGHAVQIPASRSAIQTFDIADAKRGQQWRFALQAARFTVSAGSIFIYASSALTNVQESPKELRLTLAADILFDFDKSSIRPDAKPALDRVGEIIRSKSRGVIRIEGFTDSKGAAGYNLHLSNARAESVQNWMIAQEGLHGAGFTTRGYGATRFVAPNSKPDGSDDPSGRQKNRRVEIIIQKQD
jgi:outer membrane protein OmpA-like peptidoglycan-associated protein